MEAIAVVNVPVGRYRSPAVGTWPEAAYVEDGSIGSMVARSDYEAKGYMPPFDKLPTEDEYKAAKDKRDATRT